MVGGVSGIEGIKEGRSGCGAGEQVGGVHVERGGRREGDSKWRREKMRFLSHGPAPLQGKKAIVAGAPTPCLVCTV